MAERWATFDCYGTLVDWNAGIGGELERLFGGAEAPRLLDRYHQLVEPEVQLEVRAERAAAPVGKTAPNRGSRPPH